MYVYVYDDHSHNTSHVKDHRLGAMAYVVYEVTVSPMDTYAFRPVKALYGEPWMVVHDCIVHFKLHVLPALHSRGEV